MKLRIKGNSLRLRVSPSEMERLLITGRIEETIHFAQQPDAKLTYALEQAPFKQDISVSYQPGEVTVVLSTETASEWAQGEQVGIYGSVDLGHGELELTVEKDFACLDKEGEDNQDTFANPKSVGSC